MENLDTNNKSVSGVNEISNEDVTNSSDSNALYKVFSPIAQQDIEFDAECSTNQGEYYSKESVEQMGDEQLLQELELLSQADQQIAQAFLLILTVIHDKGTLAASGYKSLKKMFMSLNISKNHVRQGYKLWKHIEMCQTLCVNPLKCPITSTRIISTKQYIDNAKFIWDKAKEITDDEFPSETHLKKIITHYFSEKTFDVKPKTVTPDLKIIKKLLVSKYEYASEILDQLLVPENFNLLQDLSAEILAQ